MGSSRDLVPPPIRISTDISNHGRYSLPKIMTDVVYADVFHRNRIEQGHTEPREDM